MSSQTIIEVTNKESTSKSVLDGNATILIQSLQSEMDEHSSNLRYEAQE